MGLSSVARWLTSVARWLTSVARWLSSVARWLTSVARWLTSVARWLTSVARWLTSVPVSLCLQHVEGHSFVSRGGTCTLLGTTQKEDDTGPMLPPTLSKQCMCTRSIFVVNDRGKQT